MLIRLLFVFACISLVSCKKEATSWNTDWSVPLISDTLNLSSLVNDSTLSVQNGAYVIDLNRTLFDVNLSELISIPDTTIREVFTTPVNLNVAPGFNIINSVEEHVLELEDLQLKRVVLKEGNIEITINNPLPTKTLFNVKLPGVSIDGVDFNENYEVPKMVNGVDGVLTKSINLKAYVIDLTGISGSGYNLIKSQITASTDPNGISVDLSTSDVINIDVTFGGVKLDYAKGFFGNRVLSDTSDLNIEVLSKINGGAIDLPNTNMKFIIENGLKVGASATLFNASNSNFNGSVVNLSHPQINIPFNIDPAIGDWSSFVPSLKELIFSSANSNIENYIENLGDIHTFAYKVELNPWGNVSGSNDEMFAQSRLKVKIEAQLPLNISLDNLSIQDTVELDFQKSTDNFRLKNGEIKLEVANAFPFDGQLNLVFLNEEGNAIDTIVGSEIIQSGQFGNLDSNTGLMVANSNVIFTINPELADNLDAVKKMIVNVKLNSIDPSTGLVEQLDIPENAFMFFKVKTNFKSQNSL